MVRFMVSMPDEMVKKLDGRAREEHRTRSELLREAVRRHLVDSAPHVAKDSPTPRATPSKKSKRGGLRKHWNSTSWKGVWPGEAAPGLIL